MNARSLIPPTRCTTLILLAFTGFLTPALVHAEVYGGIEIGSKGVKATVVELSGAGEDIKVNVKMTDTVNTTLVAGIAKEGRFAPGALEETAQAVKKYNDRFRKDFGIAPERIYVVGSSGLFAPIVDKADQIKTNQTRLVEAVKKESDLTLTFVDVNREAELSIVGTIPKNHQKKGILIDIGGGNTKGGCQIDRGRFATFGVPYGTQTFAELAKKNDIHDPKSLAKLCDEKIAPLVKKELSSFRESLKCDPVYLSGGVVWAVATFVHPLDRRPYTALTLKEVEKFEATLVTDLRAFPEPDVSAAPDNKTRQVALDEVASVKQVYTPEQLLAGIQILKTVFRELGDDNHYYFARHGYLGWILAFVAESAADR